MSFAKPECFLTQTRTSLPILRQRLFGLVRMYHIDGIEDRDKTIREMADLLDEQLSPEQWTEPLRQIFAQACLPHVQSRMKVRPVLGIEHAKGLRLAGRIWLGCTTIERLPQWIHEAALPKNRDSDLEILAEHVRHHLSNEISRRRYAQSHS